MPGLPAICERCFQLWTPMAPRCGIWLIFLAASMAFTTTSWADFGWWEGLKKHWRIRCVCWLPSGFLRPIGGSLSLGSLVLNFRPISKLPFFFQTGGVLRRGIFGKPRTLTNQPTSSWSLSVHGYMNIPSRNPLSDNFPRWTTMWRTAAPVSPRRVGEWKVTKSDWIPPMTPKWNEFTAKSKLLALQGTNISHFGKFGESSTQKCQTGGDVLVTSKVGSDWQWIQLGFFRHSRWKM